MPLVSVPALLVAAILNLVRAHTIRDGSAQKSQEEVGATVTIVIVSMVLLVPILSSQQAYELG